MARIAVGRGAFALVLATSVAASAQAPPPALTIRDVLQLRSVTHAEVSPDGTTIAFTLSVPRDLLAGKDGASFSELHVVGPDGRVRPFVTGEVNVSAIGFTADGRAVTFLAKRGGDKTKALHAMPLDGGEARKLYEFETDIAGYAFHPVLRRLAFVAAPAPAKERKQREEKGFNQEVFEEDWTAAKVFTVDLEVPGAKPQPLPLVGHASDLEWSPDGRHLLVALAPTPLVDHSYMNRKLHVIDADSADVVTAIDHRGKLGPAVFSPDGKLVALIAAADEHDPKEGRLVVASALGGITRELLPDFPGHFVSCAFTDASTLVYLADRGVETVVGTIGADGTAHRELLLQPGFVVTALALSDDGRHAALLAQTPERPAELFAWDLAGAPRRLTDANPRLAGHRIAPQEIVRWKARDGLELEGLLLHPLDVPPGGKHPLIMVVHGGPEAHNRNGWLTSYSNPGQVAAGKGYAVFYPNYRASTGRGVAFSQMDHKDPAGKEFDDLVDGVDALIARGLIDAKKVGVTGGSYGGYATGWCATKYTDRFAAGVMGFGVSNLISMMGVSDIPTEHHLVHHRLHPWEDWQLFLDRSPITHVHGCKTPLLIMAGKADPRVPPSQSHEMYRYLKESGHPAVRLVLYAGEGHGNARAASRLDYHLRMMQWFDTYLKGSGGAPPPYELDGPAILRSLAETVAGTGS